MGNPFKLFFGFAFGWLVPELPKQEIGIDVTKANTDANVPVLYGRGYGAGLLVYQATNDADSDDIKNDLLHQVIVWGEGQCGGITTNFVDDEESSSSRFTLPGGRVYHARNFTNGIANFNDPLFTASGKRSTDTFNGKLVSYVRCEMVPDVWQGQPDHKAEWTGRLISTPSGGALTASENPSSQLYDLLKSDVYGKGLLTSKLSVSSFQTAKNYCDTNVEKFPGSGTSRKLFTSNVRLDTSNTVLDNVNTLLRSMRGFLFHSDGKLKLLIEKDDAPVDFSLDENEKGFIQWGDISNSSKSNRYNRVICRYTDPDSGWTKQEAIYPEPGSEREAELLAEDNGVILEKSITLDTCIYYNEAHKHASTILEVSRQQLRTSIIWGPEASILEVGDILPAYRLSTGWAGKLFRIESVEKSLSTGEVSLRLREHQPYIYDDQNTGDKPELPDTTITYDRPATPTNLSVSDVYNDFSQVVITWDSSTTDHQIVITGSDNNQLVNSQISGKSFSINQFKIDTYSLRLFALGGLGRRSLAAILSFDITIRATDTNSPVIIVTPGEILVTPPKPLALIDIYEGVYTTNSNLDPNSDPLSSFIALADGRSLNIPSPADGQTYYLWYRLKTIQGLGVWLMIEVVGEGISKGIFDVELIALIDRIEIGGDIDLAFVELVPLIDRIKIDGFIDESIAAQAETIAELTESGNTQRAEIEANVALNVADIQTFKLEIPNLQNTLNRTNLEILELASDKFNFEKNYTQRLANNDRLVDAAVYIDADTGLIINRAFAYTDNSFSQASILVDGVDAKIVIEADRITVLDNKVISTDASLVVQAGEILQRATFTQVNTEIAGALAALTPIYSFQFNNDVEGFAGSTHDAEGFIAITTASPAVSPTVSYTAQEYPTFRMLVRLRAGGTWNGVITTNLGTTPVPEPSAENVWEVIMVKTTDTGTVTYLEFDLGDVDIDYIEIAKQGANDIALQDLVGRVTIAESSLSAIDAEYITSIVTSWYNNGSIITSDVNLLINAFDSEIDITATLQSLNDSNTIEKATISSTWVNAADANIRSSVLAYNSEFGITNVTTDLDALRGSITNQSISISNVDKSFSDFGLVQIEQEYYMHRIRTGQETGDAVIALANTELRAYVDDENTAIAQDYTSLIAIGGADSKASFDSLSESLSNEITARATQYDLLQADFNLNASLIVSNAQAISDETSARATQYNELEVVVDGNSASITNNEQAVSDEAGARALAVTQLQSNINSEASTRASSVATVQQSVVDEESARAIQGSELQANINDETSKRNSAVNTVDTARVNDKNAQATLNTALQSNINDEESSREAAISSVQNTISTDKTAQATVNNNLQSNIEDEASSRTASVNSINSTISTDKAAQAETNTNLQSNIEDEASSRTASVNSINSTISTDKAAQAETNTNLQSNIEDETSARTSEINTINNTISTDKVAQATINTNLQSNIEDEASSREAAISSVESTISTDKASQAQINTNLQSNINDEGSTRQSSVNSLNTAISNESAARATLENNLTASIETESDRIDSAVNSISSVQSDADGNLLAINSVETRTTNAEADIASAVSELSSVSDEVDGIKATATFGVDVNGNFTGVKVNGSTQASKIVFSAGEFELYDTIAEQNALEFVSGEGWKFNGAGTFSGKLRSAKIELIGTSIMEVTDPNGFGPDSLYFWSGSKDVDSNGDPRLNNLRKSNANEWKDLSGDRYFGGTLSAGLIKNAVQTTVMTNNPSLEIGPFGTNGKNKNVVVSFLMQANSTFSGSCPTHNSNPTANIRVERKVGGGSWTTFISTQAVTGNFTKEYDQETNQCFIQELLNFSATSTDTNTSAAAFQYRAIVSNQITFLNTQSRQRQILSLVVTEE
jgi:hypothetical protein